jgi:chromosome segregation ATPase
MADGSAKVEEVWPEAGDLKVQLSDCCPKVNQNITNLEQELAKLKEEMTELRVVKAAMAGQRLRHEQEIHDMKQEVELLRKAGDDQHKSQERERQAVAEVRNVVVQLTGQIKDLGAETGRERFADENIGRINEQLRAEAAGLKQRIEMLEQENRRLSEMNEVVKRDMGQVSGLKGLLGNLEAKHE